MKIRMLFLLALLLLASQGCADDDDDPAPPQGPPAKGQRLLGIDVNQAQGETWNQAYAKASETGMDFVTLPLNWNSIEPGPDDDFAFVPSGDTCLDRKKWNRVAPAGSVLETQNRALVFTEGGAGTGDGIVYSRFEVDGASFAVQVNAALNAANNDAGGYNFALILSFTQDGDNGNSAGPTDAYVAIVSTTSGGTNYLSAAFCDLGAVSTPATVAVPASAPTLRIRRSAAEFVFLYDGAGSGSFATLHTLQRSGLSASAFGGPARAYFYFGNSASAAVDFAVDDWKMTEGSAVWDDPADRFITGNGFDILGAAEAVYGSLSTGLVLSVHSINTVTTEIPSDLEIITAGGKADFSDSLVIDRFKLFLDHVKARTPGVVYRAVSVGNEIDHYLGTDDGAWTRFGAFAAAVLPHVGTVFGSGMPAGAKATFGAVQDPAMRARLVAFNASANAIFITYYPLNPDFTVRNPAAVAADFDAMISAFSASPSKMIHILEAGYPSSALCGSSEANQADFIGNLFGAWDGRMDRIAAVNITWLTDVSQATVDQWEIYYGVSDPAFLAYLATLGIRNNDGSEKAAFGRLRQEADARGW